MDATGGGRLEAILCWRLDQPGKTWSELVETFGYLTCNIIIILIILASVDIPIAAARQTSEALGSIAVFETAVRAQRILVGQEAGLGTRIRWGGSEKGRRFKVMPELGGNGKARSCGGLEVQPRRP
jgi:hypothetical protein